MEEEFQIVPLNDEHWDMEEIPNRHLCIHKHSLPHTDYAHTCVHIQITRYHHTMIH